MDFIKTKNGRLRVIRDTQMDIGKGRTPKMIQEACDKFRDLERYGFNIPHFDAVIAKRLDSKRFKRGNVYLVVDYVDGIPLDEAHSGVQEAVDMAYESYLNSMSEKKEEIIKDLRGYRQYLYGSVDEGETKPYLVDIDLNMIPELSNPRNL